MATSWTEKYCYGNKKTLARAYGVLYGATDIGHAAIRLNYLESGVLPYGYTPSGKRRFGIAAPDRHVVRRKERPTSDPTAKAAIKMVNREHYRLRKKNIAAARARRARAKA